VAWRDGEAYDDWDRIGEALFKSVVSTPVGFTPTPVGFTPGLFNALGSFLLSPIRHTSEAK